MGDSPVNLATLLLECAAERREHAQQCTNMGCHDKASQLLRECHALEAHALALGRPPTPTLDLHITSHVSTTAALPTPGTRR